MKSFKLSKYQIANLFEPDNIRSGESIETLNNWGRIEGLEELLHTNFKKGLEKNYKQHKSRIKAYGDNQPVQKPPKCISQLMVENFEDETLRILCIFVVFSLILGFFIDEPVEKWVEKISILIAVVIILFVTALSNYIKEQQFQKFQRSNNKATARDIYVYRGGDRIKILVCDLLVGDIVQISPGEILPVDGILIVGNDIQVDESFMTGSAYEIKKRVPVTYDKQERADPFLISQSKIMSGSGIMVVAAVGKNSYYGKLKMKIQCCQDETLLQVKLSDFADKTGRLGILFAIATFFVMFIHYIYDCFNAPRFIESFLTLKTIDEIIEQFINIIIILIIAVPEGLPLTVTTALAYSVRKMKEQNNLVRYFQAVENIGAADNICTDKTGTLTKNLMSVTRMFVQESIHENISKQMMSKDTGRLFSLGVCNNSNANPKFVAEKGTSLRIEQNGNKNECALLEVAYRLGYDYKKIRNKDRIKHFFPFNSERKKMATVYEDEIGKLFVFVKGPPDFMISSCTHFINRNGEVTQINQEYLNQLNNAIEGFAAASLRIFSLCYKQIKSIPEDWSQIESDLIIITIVGMKDPLRDGIQEAVSQCNEGGVIVRMVTGDNKTTAISIAKEANILDHDWESSEKDYTVMEGKQFREFVGGLVVEETEDSSFETVGNLDNFKLVRDQLRVLARSTPCDKYLLTVGLKKLGHVVAMTGDGTGDAPALKRADVGFAMGIAGTEVAKEASGIILMDDSFCSIITAIKWGRNIFDSIRKFVQFQLTVNFVALVLILIGTAIFGESPLKPIQILWINLIIDIFASLALATDHPSSELLRDKPYSKKEGLITNQMWKFIIFQGVYQIIILGVILFKGSEIFDIPSSIGAKQWSEQTGKHYTILFNVFVFLQIFNEINAKKLKNDQYNVFKNFFNNKIFLVVIVSTIIIQLIVVKYGGRYFKTVELSFKENLICIALGSTSLLSCLVFKLLLPRSSMIYLLGLRYGSFRLQNTQINEQEQEQLRKSFNRT